MPVSCLLTIFISFVLQTLSYNWTSTSLPDGDVYDNRRINISIDLNAREARNRVSIELVDQDNSPFAVATMGNLRDQSHSTPTQLKLLDPTYAKYVSYTTLTLDAFRTAWPPQSAKPK